MEALKEYKCPCCNGSIAFDSTLQKMKCPYCDTEFEMETLRGYDEDLSRASTEGEDLKCEAGGEWQEDELRGIRRYICKSCSGEIIGDATTAATDCPYCGNAVVFTEMLSGELKPDVVIPFKLDKNAAKEALKKHFKGKILLPKEFVRENHLDEIKGIYVPFWLFDADTDSSVRYRGQKKRFWSDSNYNYVKTEYYSLRREGELGFTNIPVDGSSKMADDLMESLEPYDQSAAVDFQTAYLAGYFADKYDVSAEASVGRANERIKRSVEEEFMKTTIGYIGVYTESSNVNFLRSSARYALYPVWLLTTSWKNKNYIFAMNGQTGKMVGDLPMDKKSFWLYFLGIFLGVSTVMLLLLLSGLFS